MSGIILNPGNIDVKGKLDPKALEEIEKAEEREALNAEFAGRLSPLPPYRDDAPVCDAAWWQNANGLLTKHHGVLQMPEWTHGRCIGPACVRFMKTLNVCGRLVQDYAAAAAIGAMDPREARAAVQAAALPPEDAPDER